ncbi:hypothetical protein H4W34_006528 [Actinomadura algeriensis]|uniref:Uncharacterized protein n=1 Tax=Actinomadura algeriensis TaxID=1679523 RepID=A0ABR9K1H4_9ACTN|nr:hypothetical protein [Actinomadura algeriensis]
MDVHPDSSFGCGVSEPGCSIRRNVRSASGEKCRRPMGGTVSPLNGSLAGYSATNCGCATLGLPPTALSRLAASVMCSISSSTTLRMVKCAGTLVPERIVYSPVM